MKEPGDRERLFPLEKKTVQVERALEQIPSLKVLLLNDRAVSRHHATLKWQMLDQTFLLVHQSKSNPTLVNGESFHSILLMEGDLIQMGDTKLRLEKVESKEIKSGSVAPKNHLADQEAPAPSQTLLEKALETMPKAQTEKEEPRPSKKFTWKPPEER